MKRITLITCILILMLAIACAAPQDAQPDVAATTDAPVEESAETPVEEPAGAPVEEPAEEPAETPTEEPTEEPAEEAEAITFSLTTLQGEAIDENYFFEHKLTMVNYWATWCGPCVSEIPDLSDIALSYADKGFAILGVLIWDEDIDGAKAFLNTAGVSYPVVQASGFFEQQAADYYGIPTTFFVDSTGHIVTEPMVGSMSGADWRETIDNLLAQVG